VLTTKDLGAEGISYVEEYLRANVEFGKQLGELLLASFDLADGVAWAFVPEPLPSERRSDLTNFERGGVYRRASWRSEADEWVRMKVGVLALGSCV
jgi:hypothetical protein